MMISRIYRLVLSACLLALCFPAWAQVDTTTTSSSHTVTRDRMNKGLVTGGLDALSGQAAGVVITSGANRAAMLDAVRVRGTTSLTGGNDPLVIIDGVASDIATLGTLYPGDIESFTVLKDLVRKTLNHPSWQLCWPIKNIRISL